MGLINRLALDSEIKTLMQKSQFGNQLIYCKNRTSSIYTDSSDDISSLAGSDSLLWDDRAYTTIPNTRSAQIAKIVEYFERKNAAFKSLQVPEFLKQPGGGGATSTASSSSSSSLSAAAAAQSSSGSKLMHSPAAATATTFVSHYTSTPPQLQHRPPPLATTGTHFPDCYLDYSNLGAGRKYVDLKTRADYEAFCLELDKKPLQQRIMVCEGAVRSKLPLFDKNKSGDSTAASSSSK